MRLIFTLLLVVIFSAQAFSQELNARLTINTQKIQSADKELFSSLEKTLSQILNEQKWTNLTYSKNERIDCTFAITINKVSEENNFEAEMLISSRRPVYNSSYVTTLFNFKDTQFEFSYMLGQPLDYNSSSIENNLIAVIAYYANIIIGLDADSFSSNGGKPYYAKAMEIANMAQSFGTKGWEPFSGRNSNRYDLAMALTEESSSNFHTMFYKYHRLGLDEMAANSSRGRIRIIESVGEIQELKKNRPNSPLLTIISESKIDEIVRVASQATAEEKQGLKKLLTQLFPAKGNIINTIQ